MSNAMIEVNDVTMRFHLNTDKILSLKEFLTRAIRVKIQYEDFTALNHVSFQVEKGETIGLIGHHGAGKIEKIITRDRRSGLRPKAGPVPHP